MSRQNEEEVLDSEPLIPNSEQSSEEEENKKTQIGSVSVKKNENGDDENDDNNNNEGVQDYEETDEVFPTYPPTGIRLLLYIISNIIISVIMGLHMMMMMLEMFLFTSGIGQWIFGRQYHIQATCREVAGYLGLYNGFLAIGLLWGMLVSIVAVIKTYPLIKNNLQKHKQEKGDESSFSHRNESIQYSHYIAFGFQIKIVFLCFICSAGLYGGVTNTINILYLQFFPGILGLISAVFAGC